MLKIKYHSSFKRDYKRMIKRGYDISLLDNIIRMIASGQNLPMKYKDHALIGDYVGCRECHLTPDWLLIYEILEEELILYLTKPKIVCIRLKPLCMRF